MRQGKIVLFPMFIVAALAVIGLILGLVFGLSGCKTAEPESLLKSVSIKRLTELNAKQDYEGIYLLSGREEFGYTGEIRAEAKGEDILWVSFETALLEKDNFVQENAEKVVKEYLEAYADFIGLADELQPTVLQFTNDETYQNKPDDKVKALMESYVLYEYSVRDSQGFLWIIQICSPREELLAASAIKLIDESGFEGYEPQITMERKDEN